MNLPISFGTNIRIYKELQKVIDSRTNNPMRKRVKKMKRQCLNEQIQMDNRFVKTCSCSLAIREIKTTLRLHLTLVDWPASQSVSMKSVKRTENCCITWVGIYRKNMKSAYEKWIYKPIIAAAQSTTATTWKQPRWPSKVEWIKELWWNTTQPLKRKIFYHLDLANGSS